MPAAKRLPSPPRAPVDRCEDADHANEERKDLSLVDTELMRCNLANLRARGVRASRLVVAQSRLTGIALTEGHLADVVVRDCSGDLASFGFSGLERVTFEDCVLTQAQFLEARLYDVRFLRCRLDGADFRDARMTQVEFRGCTFEGIVGVEGLRGAALEWAEVVGLAGTFADALGMDVLEDDLTYASPHATRRGV